MVWDKVEAHPQRAKAKEISLFALFFFVSTFSSSLVCLGPPALLLPLALKDGDRLRNLSGHSFSCAEIYSICRYVDQISANQGVGLIVDQICSAHSLSNNGLLKWVENYDHRGDAIACGKCRSLLDHPDCPIDRAEISNVKAFAEQSIYNQPAAQAAHSKSFWIW